ncbi:MAG: DCC1-like thiol-disulfide oxidoreductase family protein [Gaiellales bacterium]
MSHPAHRLIWDGQCGFCRRSVAAVERRDHRHAFEAVSSQSLGMGRLPAVLVETADGRRLEAGRACLFVLSELGHPRLAAVLERRPLVWAVEAGYHLVSRYRGHL